MRNRLIAVLAALGLAVLACQAPSSRAAQRTPSSVLFQDDFSNPSSGWDRVDSNEGITDYAQGYYRIYVNIKDSDIWSNPHLNFTDTRVEVEATKVSGDENNIFGLLCRYKDHENFYFLVVSSDGYYGIGKVKNGTQSLIGMENMLSTDQVIQGNAANHLRADCVKDTLALYVNGQKLSEQTDGELTSGDVGLFAGAFDTPGTDIHFDNFSVLKP